MGLGRRQVFRLTKAYGKHGPQALVSRRRGRPSNRCYPTALRKAAIHATVLIEQYCFHHQSPPVARKPNKSCRWRGHSASAPPSGPVHFRHNVYFNKKMLPISIFLH